MKVGNKMVYEEIINVYCHDNAKKIHKMVDGILKKFGGIMQDDVEECYGIAYEVFTKLINGNEYDPSKPFHSMFYAFTSNRIKDYITKKNRDKRCQKVIDTDGTVSYLYPVSLDSKICSNKDGEENVTYKELIMSDFDVWKELSEMDDIFKYDDENSIFNNVKIKKYLNRLTKKQRDSLNLIVKGYKPFEIREVLHITEKEYLDILSGIRSYKNISVLLECE